MAKMLNENPKLVRHKDLTCGYTALHWAAKHGDMDAVKLIAGTFKAQVNIK
jgi:ankyrin repeat protein